MITRVQIENFRSIANADVRMDDLTVLVGRNGAGKSTFVDVLRFVRDALRIGLENAVIERHGFASIRRWTPKGNAAVKIAIEISRDVYFSASKPQRIHGSYELTLNGKDEEFWVEKEVAKYEGLVWGKSQWAEGSNSFVREKNQLVEGTLDLMELAGSRRAAKGQTKEHLFASTQLALLLAGVSFDVSPFSTLNSGNFYSIFPNDLRQPQKPVPERILSDHGENFVAVLQQIARTASVKRDLLSALSQVTEGVDDLRVAHAGGYIFAELRQKDMMPAGPARRAKNQPWFDLSQQSDGTVRMLGLLAALHQQPHYPQRDSLLVVEEPEIALHPGALAVLSDEIKAASKRRQILVTTQSPDLIARMEADSLRVVERCDGASRIALLDETQRQAIQDHLFNAGDLLRIEGLRGRSEPGDVLAVQPEATEATVVTRDGSGEAGSDGKTARRLDRRSSNRRSGTRAPAQA